MERKQQSNEQVVAEQTQDECVEAKQPRSLCLVALEARVAPNAIWGE
jgi:hypothetical protein